MNKKKVIVRKVLNGLQIMFLVFLFVALLFCISALCVECYRDGGGLWGLFLWGCLFFLILVSLGVVADVSTDIQLWLEEDDETENKSNENIEPFTIAGERLAAAKRRSKEAFEESLRRK